ncbi:MAG: hypothetical protein V4507_16430, partial [Verrucomicrobiota bacterium]
MATFLHSWLRSAIGASSLLLVIFLTLETLSPRFFSWDDNASQFCGYYQYNYESLVHQKTFPSMVWTQYTGQTNLTQSQSGVFYLPAYIATALSWSLFKSPLWNIDLLVVLHLLIGLLGMRSY